MDHPSRDTDRRSRRDVRSKSREKGGRSVSRSRERRHHRHESSRPSSRRHEADATEHGSTVDRDKLARDASPDVSSRHKSSSHHHRHRGHHRRRDDDGGKRGDDDVSRAALRETSGGSGAGTGKVDSAALARNAAPTTRPTLHADDFSAYATPFRLWLLKEKNKILFDLLKEDAQRYVVLWKSRQGLGADFSCGKLVGVMVDCTMIGLPVELVVLAVFPA